MRVLNLPAINAEIANALDFISNSLGEFDISDKKVVQNAMLATEESLVKLLEHAPENSEMEVSVKKNLMGAVCIGLEVPGRGFHFYKDMGWHDPVDIENADSNDVEDDIRGAVMTNINGDIRYENKKNVNTVSVVIKKKV